MKRLLRQANTKLWLATDGTLTSDENRAVQIKEVTQAISLCRQHQLRAMELVLKFDGDPAVVAIPMGDVCQSH